MKSILFISGSIGLGHAARDLAIAKELRRLGDTLQISWIATGAAAQMLDSAGEAVLPEAAEFADDTDVAESVAHGSSFNILTYARSARGAWQRNTEAFTRLVTASDFDLVVGDETYEVSILLGKHPSDSFPPYVRICDFIGVDTMTHGPVEHAVCRYFNQVWVRTDRRLGSHRRVSGLFVGEPEDVPDRPFGWRLPNRRVHAEQFYSFVGWVLPFDAATLPEPEQQKERLGYGRHPLIIASVGGTSIGASLLRLCRRSLPLVRQHIPDARMVLVCGPKVTDESDACEGLEVRGFVPDLYGHFAACDLAIVQGGGTTTIELTALKRPFLYFPIEDQFEQQRIIADRLDRHHAGVRMSFRDTTPQLLADAILANLGASPDYADIPADGARRAATHILSQLEAA